ncbi:MAG: YfhO family protein [Oscillospiraceae bacterium]|jgi:uncharacterized membrane protein YfhO|nr:YfhO family protein [Oscillospiraceae bacterium]
MIKPKNPFISVKKFFKNERQIWLSFAISYAVMLISYIIFGVYPVYKNSVLSLDLNAQYAYYFAYMKDVFARDASLFYSWSRNLSGEFVGIIGYYLFSPFNLLVWIFPLSHLTEGLLLMILAKIGFVGVTMSVYLSKCRGFSKTPTVLFSVMYALTSYNIVQTMNPMWLDGVMVLPLVAMGIESLLRGGKYKLLIFSLIYAFVTCFYIGYMIGIFAALYFIYYAFSSRRASAGNAALILKRGGLFAACAVIAVLCSCFILLPVFSSLSMGKFEFAEGLFSEGYEFEAKSNFNLIEATRKLFPNSYDTVRMDGLPFLYCGTLALLTLPAYFFCPRIRRARRVSGAVLIAVLAVCMYITPVDMFWHGGQVPNWLPYRYSFMLCFLFLSFGAEAFERLRKIRYGTLGAAALFFAALLVYWEQADTFMPDLGKGRDVFDSFGAILPALGFLVLFSSFVILAKNKFGKSAAASVFIVLAVSLELLYNTAYSVYKQHVDITYSTRESFNRVILPTREVADRIKREDDGFYRMEKTYFRSANDPMALGMKGVTHSSSLLNAKAISLLKSLGYSSRSHASRYSGATPLTDDLMGFKYILSCSGNNTVNISSADDITVTVNADVMPIAYLVSPKTELLEFDVDDVFLNQNRMLSAMLGYDADQPRKYFRDVPIDDLRTVNLDYQRVTESYDRYTKRDENTEAYIEYSLIADADGDYYMYLPSDYERRCDLFVNGVSMGVYFESENHHIKNIGNFKEGDFITVKLRLQKDKVFLRNERFARLDVEWLEEDIAKLHEMNANTEFKALSNTRLRVTTDYDEESLLFMSIPDEPGWKVKVDGKKALIVQIAGGLMAVDVPPGKHTVEMEFFPNYMPMGICLSLLGICLYTLLVSLAFRKASGKKAPVAEDDCDGCDPDYSEYGADDADFDFDGLSEDFYNSEKKPDSPGEEEEGEEEALEEFDISEGFNLPEDFDPTREDEETSAEENKDASDG